MTMVQIESLAKTVMSIISGVMISYGVGDEMTWVAISGGIVAVAALAYGFYANSKVRIVKDAATFPEVDEIIVEPPLAFVAGTGKVKIRDPERDYRT